MNLKLIRPPILVALLCCGLSLIAQSAPAGPPVPYASVSQLNAIIEPLQQASESAHADLGKLRIAKRKVDSGSKKQTVKNVEYISRNLQTGLAEITGKLHS